MRRLAGRDDAFPSLARYYERLATHRIYLTRKYRIDRGLAYPELVDDFLVQRREWAGRPVVGATVHYRFDRLRMIWPDAAFIHLVRDPRDVSRSIIQMGWAGTTWTASKVWEEAEHTWDALVPKLAEGDHIEVRYEELLREPERVLGGLCRFMGVDYDPAMLSYPDDSTYGPPDPKLAFQWRRKATEEEVRLVESRLGGMIASRGYEPSGLPHLEVTPQMRTRLEARCREHRRSFRIKRFGLPLVLADYLSRRVPIKPVRDSVQLRINAIENAHLR